MASTQKEIIVKYKVEIEKSTVQLNNTKQKIDRYSYVRIVLFLAEVLFFILYLNTANDIWRTITGLILFLPILAFAFIIKKQSLLDKEADYLKQLVWVYQNEYNILVNLKNSYDDGTAYASEKHPYSSDLDIFGASSLFALTNRCSTANGNALLAHKFAQTESLPIIKGRQEAVKEVASKIDPTYGFRANLLGLDNSKIEKIKSQLQQGLSAHLKFTERNFLRFYVKVIPYLMGLMAVGALFADAIFGQVIIVFFIANIGSSAWLGSKINKVYYGFSGGSNLLNNYAKAIKWIETEQWSAGYIKNLFSSNVSVHEELNILSKIIQNFDARLNVVVGSFLNGFLLWDVRCCINLNKWHKTSSNHVIEGLDRIGDFEELISFATLHVNFPDWAFPQIENNFIIRAENLGHPLIHVDQRVLNNYALEQNPTVDIVTGSNMAGKSTFLRTLGINMVLAYAGAPVCSKELKLSIFNVVTYMRIKDSLNESTSTFKAELDRLKMILNEVAHNNHTLVLIDEMLRGTNSRDKFLGSKVFIEKLIELKIPALFATHDLQLSELEANYPELVRNYHFDIQITQGEMKFDYKLKHGACKTFNADILLKEIGLALN